MDATRGVADEAAEPCVATYRLPAGPSSPRAPELPEDLPSVSGEPILRQNAGWFCRLRWLVVGLLGAAGVAGVFPNAEAAFGLRIAPATPWALAGLLAALNLCFSRLAKRGRVGRSPRFRLQLWVQIVADLLILTAVIHWMGSDLPAAPYMYLFHLILACMVFRRAESLAVAALAAVLYVSLLLLESGGALPATTIFSQPLADPELVSSRGRGALEVGAMLMVWLVIWHLVSRLASALRQREQELAWTNLRLEASSEERAQHMLQTTHQLKAPFAAIHAQVQLLLGGYCGALPDAARSVIDKISHRCLALSRQIQEMLQLANLRSRGQTAHRQTGVDVATFLEAAIQRIEPAARQRGIRFERQLEPVTVHAVEDHLTMLLDNLVVNAVHYSYNDGVVAVSCGPDGPQTAVVTIRDRGIGIPKEKLPRIFDDYYRTEDAVRHNRSSTGLGLAIVRQVASQAGIGIEVESAPGWGTRFTLCIPGRTSNPEPSKSKTESRADAHQTPDPAPQQPNDAAPSRIA